MQWVPITDYHNPEEIIQETTKYLKQADKIVTDIISQTTTLEDDLLQIHNEVSTNDVDTISLERHNRSLDFYSDFVQTSLSRRIRQANGTEIHPIKPVNTTTAYYTHPVSLIHLSPDGDITNKKIGELTNISIERRTEDIIIRRGRKTFHLTGVNPETLPERHRYIDHLQTTLDILREIKGWLNNDISYINNCFHTLELLKESSKP